MKVIGLDNREYAWTVSRYTITHDDIRPRSSYHIRCRNMLKDMYPTSPICEEIPLPGSDNLRLDFFLPRQRIGIEVQGEQHYKMVGKFHASKQAFLDGVKRDSRKRQWCERNNIRLIALRYNHTDEQWSSQIEDRETEA